MYDLGLAFDDWGSCYLEDISIHRYVVIGTDECGILVTLDEEEIFDYSMERDPHLCYKGLGRLVWQKFLESL